MAIPVSLILAVASCSAGAAIFTWGIGFYLVIHEKNNLDMIELCSRVTLTCGAVLFVLGLVALWVK